MCVCSLCRVHRRGDSERESSLFTVPCDLYAAVLVQDKVLLQNMALRPPQDTLLWRVIRHCTALCTLDLQGNCLGNKEMESLAKCLYALPHLSELNVSRNDFDALGASHLFEPCTPAPYISPGLAGLLVSRVGITAGYHLSPNLYAPSCASHPRRRSLPPPKRLDISYNNLSLLAPEKLARFLQRTVPLQEVRPSL